MLDITLEPLRKVPRCSWIYAYGSDPVLRDEGRRAGRPAADTAKAVLGNRNSRMAVVTLPERATGHPTWELIYPTPDESSLARGQERSV